MKKIYYLKLVLVNLITFSRFIGSILIPIIYFKYGVKSLGLLILILFLTDMLDGFLSRKLKVETFLGGLMDAVSDKLFAFVLLGLLTYYYPVILIVLFLEFTIFVINTLSFKDNKNIKTSSLGRTKTVLQDISIIVMYLLLGSDIYINYLPNKFANFIIHNNLGINYILVGIMICLDVLTLCDYKKKSIKQIKYQKLNKKELLPLKDIIVFLTDREFYVKNKDKKLKELLYK